MRTLQYLLVWLLAFFGWHCRDIGEPPPAAQTISSDGDLATLILHELPYRTFELFPHSDSLVTGWLNGSPAHQPLIRVSLIDRAFRAPISGKLASGEQFPDGSLAVNQIRGGGNTPLLAVMYRDHQNPASGAERLWAEYAPDGTVEASI